MVIEELNFPLQIPMPNGVLPRFRHSAVATELAPGLIEVTFFGGSPLIDFMKSSGDQPKLAETFVATFGIIIMYFLSTSCVYFNFSDACPFTDRRHCIALVCYCMFTSNKSIYCSLAIVRIPLPVY